MTDQTEIYYAPAEAARRAGVAPSTLRSYAAMTVYRQFFSRGARPQPGQRRQYSGDDVRLVAYIAAQSAAGLPHQTIAAQLPAGVLADWQPPAEQTNQAAQGEQAAHGPQASQLALALAADLAAQRAEVKSLYERLVQSEARAAAAEQAAADLRNQLDQVTAQASRSWWARLAQLWRRR